MVVNGENVALQAAVSLQEYLESIGYDPRTIAIEKNGAIIPRESFATEILSDSDRMEIVIFAGGG